MTEIGLGLTNPYVETGDNKRVAGCVGRPYGETRVRIVAPNEEDVDSKHVLIESYKGEDVLVQPKAEMFGELQVKGKMVFKEYHGKPEKTKETFSDDGWFKTGNFKLPV